MYNTLSPVFVAHRLTHSLLLKKGGFILSVPSLFCPEWSLRTWESIAHSAIKRIFFRWNVGVATSTFACSIFVRRTINVKWQTVTIIPS